MAGPSEPVEWRADGLPRSPRFDDIYHSETGALAQARHVFLAGCGLPAAWAGAVQWRILETGFGFGLNFLAAWDAWRDDPRRPRLLHFVSIEAYPVSAEDLLRAASRHPELAALAGALAAQWHGLLPGFHRLWFEGGRVLLTLCVGDVQPMLRAQRFEADAIFLDGFSPQRNPQMWSPETLGAISRFARRGTRIATWCVAGAVREALARNGFVLERAPGLPPKRECLRGAYQPAWEPRRRMPSPAPAVPGRCAVIGAGLAGAAVAASLARRGWQVEVLEAADGPAAGASSLPVGLLAPHVSPDDALLSRLTRAGIRATWQQLEHGLGLEHKANPEDGLGPAHEESSEDSLKEGRDWRACGVLERRAEEDIRFPPGWQHDGPNESWRADEARLRAAGLPPGTAALWHARGGWVKPHRLVERWLAQPGIRLRTGCRVDWIEPAGHAGDDGPAGHAGHSEHSGRAGDARSAAARWLLHGADGRLLAEADRVVIAAGIDSRPLAPGQPLQPVRGQVEWGPMPEDSAESPWAAVPVNGAGHLIAQVPEAGALRWFAGATFDRDSEDRAPRDEDTRFSRDRLARLHPAAARAIDPLFDNGQAQRWVGVRCASADRWPLVGPLHGTGTDDGLWLCSALGSRGLSFAALCAELLAARWHGEPLPLPARLAAALDSQRGRPTREAAGSEAHRGS